MTGPAHVSLSEMAQMVPSGASIILNKGEVADTPVALLREILLNEIKDLHVVTLPTCANPVSGMMVDVLVGAGAAGSVETSGVSLGEVGSAPCFGRAVTSGDIKVTDATCPALYAAVQAGGKSQPFASMRGIIGSDLLAHRDDWKVIPNPFDEADPVVVFKAINPDVALLHARKADRNGNIWVGRNRDQIYAAHASRKVLVTVEETVDTDFYEDEAMAAGVLPAFYVDALCVAPDGAQIDPSQPNLDAVRAYRAAARDPDGFKPWLVKFLGTATAEPAE